MNTFLGCLFYIKRRFNDGIKTQQTVTLTDTSKINGVQIAYFNASILQGEGSSSVSRNIINQELYDSNRKAVRADEVEFQSKVYAIEDGLLA